MSNIEYNLEDVYYCNACLSLNILNVAGYDDMCFCDECGGTAINTTDITTWENMYKEKYGFKFLDNNNKKKYRQIHY